MCAQYGKPVSTSTSPSYGTINSGTCRASSYRPFSGYGWATQVGGHVGQYPGDGEPTFRFGVHIAVSGSPGVRVGFTDPYTVATDMADGNGGAIVQLSFDDTDQTYSPRNDALALWDGVRYAIDANPAGGERLRHGVFPAASISEAYENFYEQTGITVPPNPFNETSITNDVGWMTLWLNYVANLEPEIPVNRSPSGTITDTTPHMQGDFRDHHGVFDTDYGDRMTRFHVHVRRVGTTTLLWDSNQTASATEVGNNRFDTIYAGAVLTAGNNYEWRCRVADWFGVWSAWSTWLGFDIPSGGASAPGVLTVNGQPTGLINDTSPDYEGLWTHPVALDMSKAEVELWQNGIKINDSGAITKTVASSAAPGTLFTVTGAEAGFNLKYGAEYSYRMRAQATNGVWTNYSALRLFAVSSPPFTPNMIDPTNGEGVTTLPVLQCEMTDPDGIAGLQCHAYIMTAQAVTNGSFSGNVTGWSLLTASGVTAAIAYDSGKNQDGAGGAAKLTISASTALSGTLPVWSLGTQVIPVVSGQTYLVSCYCMVDTANLHPTAIISFYSDPAGTVLLERDDDSGGWTTGNNVWGYRELSVGAPAGAVSMRVGFGARAAADTVVGNVWGDHILIPGFTPRYRRDMTYEGAGLWSYQTTATDLPAFATYHWKARGFDGGFYSDYRETSFVYASGPVVTMLTPTANQHIVTNTPTITWSVADQQRFQVFLYEQDAVGGTGPLLFDSGEQVDPISSYVMPSGYIHNLGKYRVRVRVWDSANLDGISPNRNFDVNYGVVVPLTNFFASGYSLRYDPKPSAILLTWDVSFYPASQHEAYAVYRREASQPVTYNLLLARFTSVGQTSFIDYQPASGIEYLYTVTQMVKVGTEVIESVGVQAQLSIELGGTTISAADDGDTYRVVCQFWSERGSENNTEGNQILPWGATKPTVMFGSSFFKTIKFTARFVNTDLSTIQQMSLESDRLLARRGIVCFRDPKRRRIFGVLSKVSENDEAMGTLRVIQYELTETNYIEAF